MFFIYHLKTLRDHEDMNCSIGKIMVLVCYVIFQEHVINEYMALWVEFHQGKLPSWEIWWIFNDFYVSGDPTRSHDQSIIWCYNSELLKVGHDPGKCGGHIHFGSGGYF